MLGYWYQFSRGHLEKNETIIDCLKREIKEDNNKLKQIRDKVRNV